MRAIIFLSTLPTLLALPLHAQDPLEALRRRGAEVLQGAAAGRIVDQVLDHLLDPDKQPVTNSFDDVLRDSVLPADFDPGPYAPLGSLPRTADGGFVLRPGAYEMVVQSYCLHAGTHGPSRGSGYLPAPLEGPRADVVRGILERAVFHPEVRQRQVQVLLWAIQARTPYERMPADMQATARALLTPGQLLEINGGPLSLLPQRYEAQLRQAFDRRVARLSRPLQNVARAEAQLRTQLTQSASYEALERTAVLAGMAAETPGAPVVPRGQWMRMAGGYFIRYLPSGYARTLVQVFVPPHLRAALLILNLAIYLATPANTGSQRLAMSGRDGDGRPPPPVVQVPDAASPMPDPDCPPGEAWCGPPEPNEQWLARIRAAAEPKIDRSVLTQELPAARQTGIRWLDRNGGNYVRIDRGDPRSPQLWQRTDHVRVNYNGQVIGRNGQVVSPTSQEAHVPLSEWLEWTTWFHP